MIELSEETQHMARHLAGQILHAFEGVPPIVSVAAVIAVTGSMCFNEADGDVKEALKRAGTIASGVIDVIGKLHQDALGDGDDREGC